MKDEIPRSGSSFAPYLDLFHPSAFILHPFLFRHSKIHPNLPRAVALSLPDRHVLAGEAARIFTLRLQLEGVVAGFVREVVYEPDFQRRDGKVQGRAVGLESLSEAIVNGFAAPNYPPFRAELRAVVIKERSHAVSIAGLLPGDPFGVPGIDGFASLCQPSIVGLAGLRRSRLQQSNSQSNCQDD